MAYETSLEIVALRDSFNNVDQKNAIHEIEMKYKSDLKDAENQKLAVELAASRQKLAGRNLLLIIISLSLAILLIFCTPNISSIAGYIIRIRC